MLIKDVAIVASTTLTCLLVGIAGTVAVCLLYGAAIGTVWLAIECVS